MLRLLPLTAALAAVSLPSAALAGASHRTAGSTGVGLGVGTVGGGVSVKHFLADSHAVQGVVGLGNDTLRVSADYLLEQNTFATTDVVDLAWNIGAGVGVGIGDGGNLGLGVSGVAGLEFAFVPVPLDLVLEYRPTIAVVPDVDLELVEFTGHLRWFF